MYYVCRITFNFGVLCEFVCEIHGNNICATIRRRRVVPPPRCGDGPRSSSLTLCLLADSDVSTTLRSLFSDVSTASRSLSCDVSTASRSLLAVTSTRRRGRCSLCRESVVQSRCLAVYVSAC